MLQTWLSRSARVGMVSVERAAVFTAQEEALGHETQVAYARRDLAALELR